MVGGWIKLQLYWHVDGYTYAPASKSFMIVSRMVVEGYGLDVRYVSHVYRTLRRRHHREFNGLSHDRFYHDRAGHSMFSGFQR